MWYAAAFAALVVLFWAYGPAMHTAFLFDDTKQQFATARRIGPAVFVDRPGAPGADVHLLGQHADFPARTHLRIHLFNILIHALTGILVFLVIRRLLEWAGVDESQPHAVRGLRRTPVPAAPPADRKRRIHLRPLGLPLRNVRLRLLRRLSLPALAGHLLGRRGRGGAPVRRRRAHQGTGSGAARPICAHRFLVESGFPAAQRARQLEALRGAGGGRRRRRRALLEADSRRRHRRQRRLRHEGLHLVSVPVHPVPRASSPTSSISCCPSISMWIGISPSRTPSSITAQSSVSPDCWRWPRWPGATAAAFPWPATATLSSWCCLLPLPASCRSRTPSPTAACTCRCSA